MAGRPWKYRPCIEILPDDELFNVAKIVEHAADQGLFDYNLDNPNQRFDAADKKRARRNARSALAQMAAQKMPDKPDGKIRVDHPFEAYYLAWYGRTWKKALIG